MNQLAKRISLKNMPRKRQVECLRAIHKLEQRLGRFPTLREVSADMGLSENGAQYHLTALERLGLISEAEVIRQRRITAAGQQWL